MKRHGVGVLVGLVVVVAINRMIKSKRLYGGVLVVWTLFHQIRHNVMEALRPTYVLRHEDALHSFRTH